MQPSSRPTQTTTTLNDYTTGVTAPATTTPSARTTTVNREAHACQRLQPDRSLMDALHNATTMEARTKALQALVFANVVASGRLDPSNYAYQTIKNWPVVVPQPIPGETIESQIQRIQLNCQVALGQATKHCQEEQRKTRERVSQALLGQTTPKDIEMKARVGNRNLLAFIENERQQLEQKIVERVSQIDAYLKYSEIHQIDVDAIDPQKFAVFFTQYKLEKAERSFNELKLETKPTTAKTPSVNPKKKGRKKDKKKTPSVAVHLPASVSTAAAPIPKTPDQLRQEQCQAWFQVPGLKRDARVLRWETPHLSTIRAFNDGTAENPIHSYAGKDDEELRLIQIYHNMTGAEKVIDIADGAYIFSTPTGCGSHCRIEFDDASKPPRYGTIYFGINKSRRNAIYHRCFVEQDISTSIKAIFKGPEIQDPAKPEIDEGQAEEKEFELAGAYEPTVDKHGMIQLKYANKGYSLFIYPCRPERLREWMFTV